jgi:hypothetical protein
MFNTICKKTDNIPIICNLSLLVTKNSGLYAYKCKCSSVCDQYYAELKCYFE